MTQFGFEIPQSGLAARNSQMTSPLLSVERPTTQRPINVIALLRNAAMIWSFGNCAPETPVLTGNNALNLALQMKEL